MDKKDYHSDPDYQRCVNVALSIGLVGTVCLAAAFSFYEKQDAHTAVQESFISLQSTLRHHIAQDTITKEALSGVYVDLLAYKNLSENVWYYQSQEDLFSESIGSLETIMYGCTDTCSSLVLQVTLDKLDTAQSRMNPYGPEIYMSLGLVGVLLGAISIAAGMNAYRRREDLLEELIKCDVINLDERRKTN